MVALVDFVSLFCACLLIVRFVLETFIVFCFFVLFGGVVRMFMFV